MVPSPGYCGVCHSAYERSPERVAGRRFYSSVQWVVTRKAFLQANPYCVDGCGNLANVVDHKTAMKDGGAPFDWANLQSFYKPHHDAKTVRENGRWG